MALSWFFNWQHNVVFGTRDFHAVDQNVILGSITVEQVNPVIGSAFQLLLLVYTGMAYKFAQKPKVLSLEELEQQAQEFEQRAIYQARIDAVKKAQRAQRRVSFFEALKQTKKGVIAVVSSEDEDPLDASIDEEASDQHGERDTRTSEVETEECGVLDPMNTEGVSTSETGVSESLNGSQNGSTRRVYVSLEEAVELLQYDLSYVKSLRTKGVLKTAGRNSDLISMASIKAILSKKQGGLKKQMKGEGITTAPVDDPGMKEAKAHGTEAVYRMKEV